MSTAMLNTHASASQMMALVRSRQISCVELLQMHIQRIEAMDGSINAVVVRCFEQAQARAQAADEALQRGESWGPLHGLPITIKESFDFPGTPTTWGFAEHRDNIANQPAEAVQRLLDAGAIVMGKTNVPVALSDWQSFNPVYGTTHNPWDLRRSPGGSSGGSAAALASGMSALELGSDIGASIRNPAHYCGVYGHKPTWGVVPKRGHQLPGMRCAESGDISVAGPMARSAKDLQLAMDALTSPLSQFGPMGWMPAQWRPSKPLKQCQVAIVVDDAESPVDQSIQQRMHALADFLRAQGVSVQMDRRPVDSAQSHRVYMHLLRAATGAWLSADAYQKFQSLARSSDPAKDTMAERVWRGSTLSHRDWVEFDQQRALLRQQWNLYFESVDLLIAPVANSPAILHNHQGERWERMVKVNGQDRPHTDGLFWAGYPSVVGLPATAIPLGLSPEGLPVGAQIIGNTLADPLCLAMAQWLEDEWLGFTPPPERTI
jgi:amidase